MVRERKCGFYGKETTTNYGDSYQSQMTTKVTVGVLALQGAFHEHLVLLREASRYLEPVAEVEWNFVEVRTYEQLTACDGLIIPGGESTTVSLVAARSNLLEPLREFVKVHRKPTWGTCAGLILLAESANRTKKGGQDLVGGLDVRVNRNYFGRQTESFEAAITLPFLITNKTAEPEPFNGVFIRAPVVEKILPTVQGEQIEEASREGMVIAPSHDSSTRPLARKPVEVMARLPGQGRELTDKTVVERLNGEVGDIVAVMQENVFGTSFHPELTHDPRIHVWWLARVKEAVLKK